MRNIRIIFDIENWLWKSNFGTFWHLPSPLTQFSKSNNFLWVCWFLGKNLSNFVPSVWRLHNPYCHNACLWFYARNQVMCQSWSKLKNCVESFFVLHIAEICKIKGYIKCCLHIHSLDLQNNGLYKVLQVLPIHETVNWKFVLGAV